jgi:ArsR family transcriptional regulator, arsenate/arsenite/antimonite-responsive transcriptional repressor
MATAAALTVNDLQDTYKALADGTRLRILALLVEGEVCVCDIHDTLRLPQPTASRHLAYLRRTGLVDARREGTWMHYRLADLDPVRKAIVETAAHAISHAAGADKDRKRFERQAGKVLPVIQPPRIACCAGDTHERGRS